jgi:uncharacterized protein (DUF58 family)
MAVTRSRTRLGVTEAGRMLLLGTVFFGLAAQIVPAFGVLSALLAVMLTVLIVGFVLRPRIEMTAHLPDHVVAGQSAQFRYTLRNLARFPAYDLYVRFIELPETITLTADPGVVARLAPGESTQVVVTIQACRRGLHSIPLPVCQSSFPFNLLTFRSFRKDRQTLTVLPGFYRLQMHLTRFGAQSHYGAAGVAGRAEVSPEYAGNRPFLPGDSPRRIDTRAWARLSVPATKEYHNDADHHVAIVLDTRIGPGKRLGGGEIPELEAAISFCASVAFTIKRDCLIDWVLAGPELHELASWPRATRVDKIHETLAAVEPSESYDLEPMTAALTSHFHRISEVVFILLRPDKTYLDVLGLAVASRCHCTVYCVAKDGAEVCEDETLRSYSVSVLPPAEIMAGRLGPL